MNAVFSLSFSLRDARCLRCRNPQDRRSARTQPAAICRPPRLRLLLLPLSRALFITRQEGPHPQRRVRQAIPSAEWTARKRPAGRRHHSLRPQHDALVWSGAYAAAHLEELYRLARSKKKLTLLFASKDLRRNNAVVLKHLLEGMRKPPTGTGPGAVRSARERQAKRMSR